MDMKMTTEPALGHVLMDLRDAHSLAHEQMTWAGALFESIKMAHDCHRPHVAQHLAELGQYITNSFVANHETEVGITDKLMEQLKGSST